MGAPDVRCSQRASRQYGLITRKQALTEGLSARQIDYRLETQKWRVIHPQVYAIHGTPPTWHQHVLAAALWSGGFASHRSAGALWRLPGLAQTPALLDVTVTSCHLPPRSGIHVHHTNRLLTSDMSAVQTIPATGIERTLLDVTGICGRSTAAAALDAAIVRQLTSLLDLDDYLRLVARRGRRGCRRLRELLRERASLSTVPNSPLESRLFELIVAEGLPQPELQHEVRDRGRFVARVDFAWPDLKVILEMDGFAYHSGHSQWETDRNRRNELTVLGWTILHGTWSEVRDQAQRLLDRLRTVLIPPTFSS